ncbi:MAG: hypothetical protein JSS27_09845 [Planctomycetes bacterium]|nr:hypothetical protein [Planctomycetota bacterium]
MVKALFLAAVGLLALTGCGNKEALRATQAEYDQAVDDLAQMEAEAKKMQGVLDMIQRVADAKAAAMTKEERLKYLKGQLNGEKDPRVASGEETLAQMQTRIAEQRALIRELEKRLNQLKI